MAELLSWDKKTAQEVILALGSGLRGLSGDEVAKRQKTEGRNVLFERRATPALTIWLRQFASPLFFILAAAAVISLWLGEMVDVGLILSILLINVLLGFFQEYKADRALLALEAMLPLLVNVRRDGRVISVDAAELVPGDLLLLRAGDKIPADGKIISAQQLAVNEAALTGESVPVEKGRADTLVFAGTAVVEGKAEVIVTATGRQTKFGQIANLVEHTTDGQTPLQRELLQISKVLTVIFGLVVVAVFVLGLGRGLPWLNMLEIAAALGVAAVPEGLLVSLTVVLTAGMRRMLKRHALVKRLIAAETLGSVTVMCVDKTGTLTTGEMTVTEVRSGVKLVDLTKFGAEAGRLGLALSRIKDVDGLRMSSTEQAITAFVDKEQLVSSSEAALLAEIPFDSRRKYSAKLWREGGEDVLYVFGAPEIILARLDANDAALTAYHTVLKDMAKRGLRVVVVAERREFSSTELHDNEVRDLSMLGIVGLTDPLRPHARETVLGAARAGVRTVMVTGDHADTAAVVARELGLVVTPESIIVGTEMTKMTDSELSRRIAKVNVFARVLPEDKVRILRALQAQDEIVAMTGDGVNDAPALKAADIGVAVGSGTDVAKEAADMVILDNDVRSLVAAIYEGRVIFENLRKIIAYLLTFCLGEVAVIAFALLLGFPLPFSPMIILWINLLMDGLPAIALAFESGEKGLMSEPPSASTESILSPKLIGFMLALGSITVFSLLVAEVYLTQVDATVPVIATFLFLSLGLDSLFSVFVIRNLRGRFFAGAQSNPLLTAAFFLSLAMLFLPVAEPHLRVIFGFSLLSPALGATLLIITVAKLGLFELIKLTIYKQPKAVIKPFIG